jgi:hypothetical protein
MTAYLFAVSHFNIFVMSQGSGRARQIKEFAQNL